MDEIIRAAAFYVTSLLYPLVTGPLAAYVLVAALKRHDRRLVLFFWPVLVALHAAGYWLMMRTLGDLLFGPGAIACLVTPIFAAGTALGLRLASRRLDRAVGADPTRRRWLVAGTVLIPLLQLLTVVTLVLFAPSRQVESMTVWWTHEIGECFDGFRFIR